MIDELAERVWKNPRFQRTAKAVEKAWLMGELKLPKPPNISEIMASQAISSAVILASSSEVTHRIAALRLATYVYELFETSRLPVSSALRVVFTRLGNFPSVNTRASVREALKDLPLILAAEEIALASKQTIEVGNKRSTLTNFQYGLWKDLSENKSVALSAPTSGGKSFILELYLASLFGGEPRWVFYLVPTRALISQVADEIAAIFSARGLLAPDIVTVPLGIDNDLPKNAIFVMTQERLNLTLHSHPTASAAVVVVDEAHSISEGARGILLQSVIDEVLARNPRTQILFASPSTKNLEAFGRIFGRSDVEPRSTPEPTVSQNFIVANSARSGLISFIATRDSGRTLELGEISTEIPMQTRVQKLAHLPVAICHGQPNLIYANGADEAEEIALLIAKHAPPTSPNQQLINLAGLAKESVHSKYVLAECVEKGVGFHYANIPTKLRQELEAAFRSGQLKYLVCTSTLLQGVNLPARNLFLFRPTRGKGSPLEPQDFWNLAGRAGRMLREFQGNIFLINYNEWPTKP